MEVVIIDYGAGNVRSVMYTLQRLGVKVQLTDAPEEIIKADKVIFPGVGEARSAMEVIKYKGLDKVIPNLKQDVMGICLGMQLMCRASEERETKCLDIFDVDVLRFDDKLKVPHMGWNLVDFDNHKLFEGISGDAYFYFVHSYYVPASPFTVGKTEYGISYSSIIHKDNFYGCQFHPEKSGNNGALVLENFLKL